jgi:hypothetical protein
MLLPRPNPQLSVQILKRRGPVIAQPLLLDLPQPVSTFTLRTAPTQSLDPGLLTSAHSAPDTRIHATARPLIPRASQVLAH